MSPIKRGASDVVKIYRGGTPVVAAHRAGSQVFGGTTIAPATVRAVSTATPGYVTSAPIAKPTGTTTGDLLLLFTFVDYGTATELGHPPEFTQLAEHDLGSNLSKVNVSYRVATSSEPTSWNVPVSSSADVVIALYAIQDWSGTTADIRIATAASPTSNTTHTAPTVTPATGYGLVIASVQHPSSAVGTFSFTPPSGYTERTDNTSGGGYMGATTATRQWDSTSAVPAASFGVSTSTAGAQGVGVQVVVPSKTGGGGGSTGTPAVFPSVRGFTQKGEAGGSSVARTIAQTSPAPVAGDLILFVVSMTSGSATDFTNMTIPSGFTELASHNITTSTANKAVTTENKIRMGYKVATASEPTSYGYNVPTSYSHRADLIVIKDWNNSFTPIATSAVPASNQGIVPVNSGSNPDTYNLTPVTPHNDTGLLLMTMSTRTSSATTSHGFNWDWSGSGGLTELTDLTGNNIQTMSTATQQWTVATAASGKQVVLNRGTAEDRQATGVSIIIPGTPATGGGGGGTGPTGGDYTNGSGGAKEDVTGLTHNNGVKTSTYHLFAGGLDWTKNVGLMVYGDGSGEYGYQPAQITNQSPYLLYGTTGLIAVAKKHNMVLLAPMAPGDGCTDNDGVCWYMNSFDGTTQAQKTAWSKSLVDYILGRYNIDKQRVVLAGYSSGAQWTMQYFGPLHGPSVMTDGLLLAISYGGEPQGTINYTTAYKQAVAAVWDVGDQDPAYNSDGIWDAQSGYDWYRLNGFTTTQLHVIAGKGHDRYNTTTMVGEFGGIVDREITEHVKPA